jgi:hypothetical protein
MACSAPDPSVRRLGVRAAPSRFAGGDVRVGDHAVGERGVRIGAGEGSSSLAARGKTVQRRLVDLLSGEAVLLHVFAREDPFPDLVARDRALLDLPVRDRLGRQPPGPDRLPRDLPIDDDPHDMPGKLRAIG